MRLSKRASKEFRLQEEITFIPSTRFDVIRTVMIFLTDTENKNCQYQITVYIMDQGMGRLGYYDFSFDSFEDAKKTYQEIANIIKKVRREVETKMLPSTQVEMLCKKALDPLSKKDKVSSSYYGR